MQWESILRGMSCAGENKDFQKYVQNLMQNYDDKHSDRTTGLVIQVKIIFSNDKLIYAISML